MTTWTWWAWQHGGAEFFPRNVPFPGDQDNIYAVDPVTRADIGA